MVSVFDVLLGIVPCTTSIAEVVRHELAGHNYCCKECTKSGVVNAESNNDWCENCKKCRSGELTQRCCCTNVNNWAVVRLLSAGHDATVCKLVTYFLYNHTCGAANGANGKCREEECNRATDEETNESLHVGNVDLRFNSFEHVATFKTLADEIGGLAVERKVSFAVTKSKFTSNCFNVRRKECHSCNHCRTNRKTLCNGFCCVSNSIEAHHDAFWFTMELAAHFSNTCGIVRNRTESIFRNDDASGGKHSHATQSNKVKREL